MKRSTRASSRSLSSEGDSSSVEKKTTYQKKKGKKLPPLCEPTQWVAILPGELRFCKVLSKFIVGMHVYLQKELKILEVAIPLYLLSILKQVSLFIS